MNKMTHNFFKDHGNNNLSRCFLLLIGLLFTLTVEASHFRFGHFTWQARPDISPQTADFSMTVAFRSSAFGHPAIGQTFSPGRFTFGDGGAASYRFEVIARNLQEDWIVGRAIEAGQQNGIVRHVYPSVNNNGSPWRAAFESCCKIGSLRNAANANWRVITQVNLADGNSSPFSNLPPIVTCSKFDCRFLIPAVDPNGDKLVWRMATRGESAISSIPSGMVVDSDTGIFTWDGSSSFSNGLYSVQVIIEDRDADNLIKSNTAIDFIINLQDQGANAPPQFDTPPTPQSGTILRAIVGQALDITVQATDSDANDEVFLNHVGLPQGATFEQTVSGGVTGVAKLLWTPTTNDIGQHIVTFLANDNRGGASTPVAVTIDVIKPAISDVRVVSTINTTDIQIDASSYSIAPSQITVEQGHTLVSWHFETFNVGQIENLNTQLQLFNLQPAEQRVVTEKLELFYTDIDGQPVYELLDKQIVKVASSLTRVSISTDKTLYLPGEVVTVASLLQNLSDIPATATVVLEIVDNQQNLVTSLGSFTEADITAKGQRPLPDTLFDTTGVYAGAYEAVAKLVENGDVVQQAMASFAIATDNGQFVNVGSLVNSDKPIYQAWDQAIIGLRVLNLTQNATFSGGQGQLRITRPNGELLSQQTYSLNSLAPSANADRQYVLALVDREPGNYQVQWTVRQNDTTLATSSAVFAVERSAVTALLGAVSVNKYPTGEAQSCAFETNNRSATSPITANLVYQLVNLDTSELVYEIKQTNVAISNSAAHPYQLLLGDAPAYGGYACILMAEIDGELSQLAAAGFEVTPPELNVSLTPAAQGKLLILLDSSATQDSQSAEQQRQYLEQLLLANQWRYTLVDNQADFVSEFYSGIYAAIALFSDKVTLHPEVEGLLVEAQHSGVGLLISGSWNRRNSQLERALAISLNGKNNQTASINLVAGAIESPLTTTARVPEGLVLAHCQAEVWATFAGGKNANSDCAYPSAPAAVTVGNYGNGKNSYFAYDLLDLATADQGLHQQLLLQALLYIQPEVWPTGAGRVIPVSLTLENLSRKAAVDVWLSLPQGGVIIDSQQALQLTEGKWLWQRDFSAAGQSASNQFYIQLPEQVSGDIYLEVDIDAGINRSLIVDNQNIALKLAAISSLSPYQRALNQIDELRLQGSGVAKYDFIIKRINAAQSDLAKGKIDKAFHPLLQAADEIGKEQSASATKARLIIGEWLFVLQQQQYKAGK